MVSHQISNKQLVWTFAKWDERNKLLEVQISFYSKLELDLLALMGYSQKFFVATKIELDGIVDHKKEDAQSLIYHLVFWGI